MNPNVLVKRLGLCVYQDTWQRMKDFTLNRNTGDADEIWSLQHQPVFTQGTSCHHIPDSGHPVIPVVHSDRGGQITYHGPGQLVVYLMFDLKRRRIGPKSLVSQIEQSIIGLLDDFGIPGVRRPGAPGIYVGNAKIAALGLRIRRGCCYHGLSLNVNMDLEPFKRIDPCGFPDLAVTQITEYVDADFGDVEDDLIRHLLIQFG